MNKSPNIVFVLTDDQGYPPLGVHGHPVVKTPCIDRFHAESVRFEQFHVGTTCAPTRAGLMTGHYCNSTGVWHTVGGRSLLQKDEWSLATALRDNGYRTGLFGKWHLGDEHPYRPQDRGFDQVVCHGGGGISQQPDWWGNDYFDDTYLVNGEPREFQGYCTDVFFDEAFRFIEANREQPFFCYISTNAPHSPFNVDPHYRDLYMQHVDNEKYARFLGMITNIDDNFGRLRNKLQELGLEENTILIFMSDNGQTPAGDPEAYNAGMRGMKGSAYEGGHRVPFFFRWPAGGYDKPRDVQEITSYVDFMPTLLDLSGIDFPAGNPSFHGDSLVPLLRGENEVYWRDRVFVTDTQRVAHPLKWRKSCVIKDRWRLVNRDELYDIKADPAQETNIADRHPELVAELQKAYEDWWELCSRQREREFPISLGSETETVLRSHDLRNELDSNVVWNQGQVRRGDTCHGYWEVFVEKPGVYDFELRRWPPETEHAVVDGISGDDVDFYHEGIAPGSEFYYTGGEPLDVDSAQLELTGMSEVYRNVEAGMAGVTFQVKLDEGSYHVRARFSSCKSGFHTSAYYVRVRRVAD